MKNKSNQKEKNCTILEKNRINEYICYYKIKNNEDGNAYYIKKIKLADESKEELAELSNEIEVLSNIKDEYIFKYVKSFIKNDYFNIVMEFYEELNLRELINKYKNENEFIKEKNIYYLIKYICSGIKAIHNNNIIHGNLTPDFIYLTKDKKIKIGNFEVFKKLYNYNEYLLSNNNINNYLAPEIIKGENITNKVDIWSLGCILYELCTLDYCFNSDNIISLNNKIINEKTPKINLKIYDKEIQKLINSMLQKDPNKRPNIDEIYNIIIKYCDNKKNKKCVENEIKIIIEITEEDINKDIYFLDNTDYIDENGNKHFHNSLKELEDIKIELFIDNKKYEFKKFNNFFEAKEYKITLKFYNYLRDCSCMFYNCKNIKYIDLSDFISKNVTDMNHMFYNCEKLIDINLSKFNTENVVSMKNMFYNCMNLTNIDLHTLNTKNVINMSGMFYGCEKLKKINILNFDTKNVTDLSNLFRNCSNLSDIDLSLIDTYTVKNMSGMFSMCKNIEKLDLSKFDTSNVEYMDEMFSFCTKLTRLVLNSFSTINLKSMEEMFSNCRSLIYLDLSNFKTDKVENMKKLFYSCNNIQNLNILNFDMNQVNNYYQMFYNCYNLKTIKINKNNCALLKAIKDEEINPEILTNIE